MLAAGHEPPKIRSNAVLDDSYRLIDRPTRPGPTRAVMQIATPTGVHTGEDFININTEGSSHDWHGQELVGFARSKKRQGGKIHRRRGLWVSFQTRNDGDVTERNILDFIAVSRLPVRFRQAIGFQSSEKAKILKFLRRRSFQAEHSKRPATRRRFEWPPAPV
jgi:hypothetical protein